MLSGLKLHLLNKVKLILSIFIFFWGLLSIAHTQSINTEHTLKLDDPNFLYEASIEDMAWIAGSWKGNAFGGNFEETWSVPSGGSMVGTFKLIHNNQPSIYELMLIVENEGSLILKLKHFNADFTGWEEKDKFISFPLVKLTDDAAYFDGQTYFREGPDRIKVYLAIEDKDGIREEEFVFYRM